MEPSVQHPFRGLLPASGPLRLSGEHTAFVVVDMQYFGATGSRPARGAQPRRSFRLARDRRNGASPFDQESHSRT
jgi:hypothetical protein